MVSEVGIACARIGEAARSKLSWDFTKMLGHFEFEIAGIHYRLIEPVFILRSILFLILSNDLLLQFSCKSYEYDSLLSGEI